MLEKLRQAVWEANVGLVKHGLVTMQSGNASGRDHGTGYVIIKPSGADYETLTPADLVVVDVDGNIVEGTLRPSVDTSHHVYLYRHRPELGGVVHTHSHYATAFAALGRAIPCYLTAIADEFGPEIPCTAFATNEGDAIGEAMVAVMNDSPAILLKHHGVFAFDATPAKALKAAVMVEDVAKTVHLALLLGRPDVIPPEEARKWWDRYHGAYGQDP